MLHIRLLCANNVRRHENTLQQGFLYSLERRRRKASYSVNSSCLTTYDGEASFYAQRRGSCGSYWCVGGMRGTIWWPWLWEAALFVILTNSAAELITSIRPIAGAQDGSTRPPTKPAPVVWSVTACHHQATARFASTVRRRPLDHRARFVTQ